MSMRSQSNAAAAAVRRGQKYGALVEGLAEAIALPAAYEEKLRNMVQLSVKKSNQYESLLRNNLDMRHYDRTQVGLLCYILDGPYKDKSPATIEHLRSALRWHCKRENEYLHPWLDELIDTCTTGYYAAYAGRHSTVTKRTGVITAPMMEQLLTFMGERAPAWVRDGVVVQWAFSLRGGQVKQVQLQNLVRENGQWVATVPMDKMTLGEEKRKKYQGQHETHMIIPAPRARNTIDRLVAALQARNAPSNTPLIDKYALTTINRWIKLAAAHFGWNTEYVIYRGSHSLRHGGANVARDWIEANTLGAGAGVPGAVQHEQMCEEVSKYTAHRGKATAGIYFLSNEERNRSGYAMQQREEMRRAAEAARIGAADRSDSDEEDEPADGADKDEWCCRELEKIAKGAKMKPEIIAHENHEQDLSDKCYEILERARKAAAENMKKREGQDTRAGGGAAAGPAKPKAKQAKKEAPRQAGKRRQRAEEDDE